MFVFVHKVRYYETDKMGVTVSLKRTNPQLFEKLSELTATPV